MTDTEVTELRKIQASPEQLYERLAKTAKGARGLAIARLTNEIQGALCEAVEDYAESARKRRFAKKVYALLEGDRSDLKIDQIAGLMHDLGKEIMITVVPAGEPRRLAVQEMAEIASGRGDDPKTQGDNAVTRYFYDTEFIEDGRTIDLIAIGIVAEDDREYYAVIDDPLIWNKAANIEWMRTKVLPSLPLIIRRDSVDVTFGQDGQATNEGGGFYAQQDRDHPDFPRIKDRAQIMHEVRDFLTAGGDTIDLHGAYYRPHYHAALSQLFEPNINYPEGIRIWANDIIGKAELRGVKDQLPKKKDGLNNALANARHVKVIHAWLSEH